ncbi:hypothetical protein B0J14DRAFT_47245 [Halenospora varia]|nr:hypothetical protein B0J14DRAFT_47245 [Halenospora varia]
MSLSTLLSPETTLSAIRIIPLATSSAFCIAMGHQYLLFTGLHSVTPFSQCGSPLTIATIRALGHRLIFIMSFAMLSDLFISLLNLFLNFENTTGNAKLLYIASFVLKILHFVPHRQATNLRRAIKAQETGDEAGKKLFGAMDEFGKLNAWRLWVVDLPAWVLTLCAVLSVVRK